MSLSVRNLLGNEEEEQDDFECCSLTYKQRVWGFGICFALGIMMSIISCFFVLNIADHPEKFAVPYTFGNILSIAGSMFLMGPMKQLKRMFDKKRVIATVVYLVSLVLTLVVAFTIKNPGLVVLCLIVQWIALFWYALSYIPYGRSAFKNCCKGMFSV
ncbi:MAG: hypothetical protein MHM6MM_005317 [Cercozoa sp. M6MM]